eukprot:1160534-Pelagomonas_calceolata.AAC.14
MLPSSKLLTFIAYLLPLGNQQQTIHQRLPHPHARVGVAVNNTTSLEHELQISSQLKFCNTLAYWPAGRVHRWTEKYPERATPVPRTSKGLRWPAGKAKTKNTPVKGLLGKQAKFQGGWLAGWLRPRTAACKGFQKNYTALSTASHSPLTPQGYQGVLVGRLAKVSGQGVGLVSQGGRC